MSFPIHCHPCDNHCKEVLKRRHPNFKAQSSVTDRSCTLYSLTFEIFCSFEWLAVPPFSLSSPQVPKAVKWKRTGISQPVNPITVHRGYYCLSPRTCVKKRKASFVRHKLQWEKGQAQQGSFPLPVARMKAGNS